MNTKRDLSVDICKGVGIMLMVLGHSGLPKAGHDFIYMFHMPLFFFLSGYCFKEKYLGDYEGFIKRKIKTLWWPYVKYSLLFLLLHNIFCYLHIYSVEYGYQGNGVLPITLSEAKDTVWSIVTNMSGEDQLLGGFWFLKELLLGSIVALVTMILIKRFSSRFSVICLKSGGAFFLLMFSVLMNKYVLIFPCFGIRSVTLLSAAIFLAGHLCHELKWNGNLGWGFFFALIILVGSILMPREILHLAWYEIVPYFIFGLIGSMMALIFSRFLAERFPKISDLVSWIGRNTMTILTWHFLSFKIVTFILIKKYDLSIEHLGEFPVMYNYSLQGWWIAYFAIAMFFTMIISYIQSVVNRK